MVPLELVSAMTFAGGALAAWWPWRRSRPRAIGYREGALGVPFDLGAWEGVRVASEASFHVERMRTASAGDAWVGVARDGDHTERQPFEAFPLRTRRLEIQRVAGAARRFIARERPLADADFDGDGPLTPLSPASWSWEGIRIHAPRRISRAASLALQASHAGLHAPGHKPTPRVIVAGIYMARQSSTRAAASDWAFTNHATPTLVLRDLVADQELHRASLDRIRAERRAIVDGLSISYAMPSPAPHVPDDPSRRDGAPFVVDIGFYLSARATAWDLGVHAEFGPLRSEVVVIKIEP